MHLIESLNPGWRPKTVLTFNLPLENPPKFHTLDIF